MSFSFSFCLLSALETPQANSARHLYYFTTKTMCSTRFSILSPLLFSRPLLESRPNSVEHSFACSLSFWTFHHKLIVHHSFQFESRKRNSSWFINMYECETMPHEITSCLLEASNAPKYNQIYNRTPKAFRRSRDFLVVDVDVVVVSLTVLHTRVIHIYLMNFSPPKKRERNPLSIQKLEYKFHLNARST